MALDLLVPLGMELLLICCNMIVTAFALLYIEFTKLNPIGYVPVLVDEDIVISDSFAICMVSVQTSIPLPSCFIGLQMIIVLF